MRDVFKYDVMMWPIIRQYKTMLWLALGSFYSWFIWYRLGRSVHNMDRNVSQSYINNG